MDKAKSEESLKAWEWLVILFGLAQGLFLLVLLVLFYTMQYNPEFLMEIGMKDLLSKNLVANK